jgi:hypothetical protein
MPASPGARKDSSLDTSQQQEDAVYRIEDRPPRLKAGASRSDPHRQSGPARRARAACPCEGLDTGAWPRSWSRTARPAGGAQASSALTSSPVFRRATGRSAMQARSTISAVSSAAVLSSIGETLSRVSAGVSR